jgi:hypothetical protein
VNEEWLVGRPKPKIISVWPTLRDVLQVVFFNIIVLHKSLQESFWDATNQIFTIWTNYGRKTASKKNIKAKITRKYVFYMNLRKSKNRSSVLQQERKVDFERSLDIMFDASDNTAGQSSCVLVETEPKSVVVVPDPNNNMGQGQTPAAATEKTDSDMEISEEEEIDEDFAEEMSKYHRQKLLPAGTNPLKERSLIDIIMGSRDVISMAERINLSTRKFLLFVASIARLLVKI